MSGRKNLELLFRVLIKKYKHDGWMMTFAKETAEGVRWVALFEVTLFLGLSAFDK